MCSLIFDDILYFLLFIKYNEYSSLYAPHYFSGSYILITFYDTSDALIHNIHFYFFTFSRRVTRKGKQICKEKTHIEMTIPKQMLSRILTERYTYNEVHEVVCEGRELSFEIRL